MIKVSIETLWKIAVLIILGIIAFYSYRIDNALSNYSYSTVGCGIYSVGSTTTTTMPNLCARPLSTNSAK